MPIYKADLSVSGLNELIKKVNEYAEKVKSSPNRIVDKLVAVGELEIDKNIQDITDKDGNVLANVGSAVFDNNGIVYMQGDQAAYLEYGTGEMGETSPHPGADEVGWNYSSGKTIRTMKNGKRMWRYRVSGTGQWRYTNGIPAGKVVLNASQQMRLDIVSAAKEVIK